MRNERRDLYQILEVDPRAGIDQIKLAYRRLARRYHPDINPSPNAKGRMQEINQAYEVLGDPVKRARYDRWRVLIQGSWATYASPRSPRTARPQRQPNQRQRRHPPPRGERNQYPPPRCDVWGQRSPDPRSAQYRTTSGQRRRSRTGSPNWWLWLLIPALINIFSSSISFNRNDIKSQPVVRNQVNAQARAVVASVWPVVMQENFSPSNPNQWSTGRHTSDRVTIRKEIDGTYLWEAESHQGVTARSHAPCDSQWSMKDFYVSVDGRRVTDSTNTAMGLVFRSHKGNYYILLVGKEQSFKVALMKNDQWTTLIPWTRSDAIKPYEVNKIAVIGEGSHFLFFVNNQYVGEVEDHQLPYGSVGIAITLYHADDHAVFEFDNFELRQPLASSATQSQPTATPIATHTHNPVMEHLIR
jgi:hypothetical protein